MDVVVCQGLGLVSSSGKQGKVGGSCTKIIVVDLCDQRALVKELSVASNRSIINHNISICFVQITKRIQASCFFYFDKSLIQPNFHIGINREPIE